jgi:hypothetical protein
MKVSYKDKNVRLVPPTTSKFCPGCMFRGKNRGYSYCKFGDPFRLLCTVTKKIFKPTFNEKFEIITKLHLEIQVELIF